MKMESAYVSKYIFEFKLQFYKDVVDLHYKLLNILSLICFDTGNYYCFCTKYKGCEEEYNAGSRLCPLCRIPIHFNNFEEFLLKYPVHNGSSRGERSTASSYVSSSMSSHGKDSFGYH